MGIWDALKSVGRKILGAGKSVGRKILGGLNTARNWIKSGYGKIRNIPVLGGLVDTALDKIKLPFIGKSVKDLADTADKGLTTATKLSEGDYRGAMDTARQIKLKTGGVLNRNVLDIARGQAQKTQDMMTGMGSNLRIRNKPVNSIMPNVRPLPRPINLQRPMMMTR